MKTTIEIDYAPYEQQFEFHNSQKKFKAFIGGLGSGKTMAGSIETIATMLENPGTLGAVLAPTYPMLRDSTIRTFLSLLPPSVIVHYGRTEQRLEIRNGSEVIFRPCDDPATIDKMRNINLGWWWIDEASLVPEYAYRVLVGRLRNPKGPLKGWITTTPKGFNWIWERWVKNPTKDYFLIRTATMENPYLPKEYVETMQREYTGVFAKQEIYGEFVGHEGLVYPEFQRDIHVIDTSKIEFKEVIAGVDFGFTNPSAVVVVGFDNDERAYVIREFYQTHVTDIELAKWVKVNMPEVKRFIADSANPSGIQEFKNMNMSCKGVVKQSGERENSFVLAGIKRLSNRLQIRDDGKPRLFVDQKCVNTIMEFENYRYPEKKEERPIQEMPLKIHDHCLVGDTLIHTHKGEIPIKNIRKGNMVLTRDGYKPVVWAGITQRNAVIWEMRLSNGNVLKGTRNHPVYVTPMNSFLSMDAISNTYKLETVKNNVWLKKSFTTGLYSERTTKQDIIGPTGQKSRRALALCIGRFGRNIMEKFPKACISIIKIPIKTTILYPTFNWFRPDNTTVFTPKHITQNTSGERENLQKNGTVVERVSNGIKNTLKNVGRKEFPLRKHALNVVRILMTGRGEKQQSIVPINAKPEVTVRPTVIRNTKRREDVYNLLVEGKHEFYANGILVHNCMDALRYALEEKRMKFVMAFA